MATETGTFDFVLPKEIEALPFDDYKLKTVQDIVSSRSTTNGYKALLFYNGDHWQKGDGWIGPKYSSDHELYQETIARIEATMISHNVIAEMVDRHVDGVLGRELHWKFVDSQEPEPVEEKSPSGEVIQKEGEPDPGTQALIDEAQSLMVSWWDKRNILETLKNALTGLLCSRRAPLRFSVPPGLKQKDGTLKAADIESALDYIYLDHMGYDEDSLEQVLPAATVYHNKVTRQPIGVFSYKDGEDDRAEISYINEEGMTVLRIMGKDADISQPVELPLGGRILLHEMTRKALVTPQIMSQQRSLNKTLSMKDRNDTQGGYLERFLINVKWPTKKTQNADGTVTETPERMFTGPGTVNALQGSTYQDEMGVTHVLNPSVQFRDPVAASTFIESANHTYLGMLTEGKQLHHASTDADVSGESRKQARESYIKDLQGSAGVVEAAVRWLLETGLAEASYFAGQAGRFERLRVYAQCKIDPGPVSPDDMRVAAEMLDRGLWDWETAVSATGVDDVDSIKQRLAVERAENEARQLATQQMMGEGLPEEGAEDGSDPAAGAQDGLAGEGAGQPMKGLNGIQIRAATDLLDRVKAGTITADNAVELLTSLGIDRTTAQNMVKRV